MAESGEDRFEGGCTCGAVRYRMLSAPLIVHGCHCRWCQRETGTGFATNALIETDRLVTLAGEPERVMTPSESGKGQLIDRCPTCRVALWSVYHEIEPLRFVRVGTLDDPDRHPPGVHIHTSSKQPWIRLPEEVPAFEEGYDTMQVWSPSSLERRTAFLAGWKRS